MSSTKCRASPDADLLQPGVDLQSCTKVAPSLPLRSTRLGTAAFIPRQIHGSSGLSGAVADDAPDGCRGPPSGVLDQNDAQNELCVPVVTTEGESFRMKEAKTRGGGPPKNKACGAS